jgi:hypothetical protein
MSHAGQGLDGQEVGENIVRAWEAWTARGSGKVLGAFISGVTFGYVGHLLTDNLMPQPPISTGVFWTAGSAVLFGMLGYIRTAGFDRLVEGIASAPRTIGHILSRDGAGARSHMLWGAGVATLTSLVVSSSAALMVGVSFLTAVPSAAGKLVGALLEAATPSTRMNSPTSFLVGLLGAAMAMFVGAVVRDSKAKLAIAGLCLAGGWLLGRGGGGGRSGGASSFLLIVAAGLGIQAGLDLFHPLAAYAQGEGTDAPSEIVPPRYEGGERPIPGEMGVPRYEGGERPIPGEMGNPLQGGGWWSQWGDDVGSGFGGGAGATLGWLLGSFGGWLRTGGSDSFDPGAYDPPAPPQPTPPPYQPPPVRRAAPPPSVPDTADDLPPSPEPAVADLPPAPVAEGAGPPAVRADAADDLPDLTYAPATRDALTAEDPADDLPPVDEAVAIEPLAPAPRPGEGELMRDDETGEPVVIAPLANSDLPVVERTEDLPPTADEPTEAQKIAQALRDLKSRAPGMDAAVIERVLAGLDLNDPSGADLERLDRLAKAAISRIEGAEAYPEAAAAAASYDNYLWGTTIAAAIGQGVASVVWGPGAAGVIYGAAGGMDFNRPLDDMTDRMAFGAAFGGALGLAFGKAGEALPKFLASKAPALANRLNSWDIPLARSVASTAVGAAISGGWAALSGESRSDVKLAFLAGGVGGFVGNYAAQEAVRATELAKLRQTFDTTPGVLTDDTAIKFGQKAVSPTFSNAGKYHGAKLEDVAIRLAVGGDDFGRVVYPGETVKLPGMDPFTVLDPADINVQFMWSNKEPFVINNRSTTTLSLAGKKPATMVDMTNKMPRWGPDSEVSVLTRLTEMGNKPAVVSKVRLVDKRSSPIHYEVPIYDPTWDH